MTDQHGCAFEGCCPRRNTSARLIDPRMPELARCLTLFQYVQAVTGGPVARMDQVGSYAVPSLRGEAFAVHPGEIALRLDADGVDTAVLARDEGAVAVRLLDAAGRIVHEGRLLSDGDRLLAGLAPTIDAGSMAVEPSRVPEVPAWENGDQLAQLDAILADGGLARRAAFDRYRGEHREIEAGVVSAVLDHVCSVGLPIGVAVFAPAAMQVCGGRVHVTDRTVGGRVFAAFADSSVEIDLAAVRACHLVRSTAVHGPTSALELDDEDGRCVAVVTQFGMVGEQVHTAWEHLAESLPDA
jgi:putative hemin transport protein